MEKQIINVPKEVRYISEWTDFPKEQLSIGHCIVNKTITGCGYTHYTLTNDQWVILCSPRKFLLENKHIQLPNTYLVINSGEKSLDIDGESKEKISKDKKKSARFEDSGEYYKKETNNSFSLISSLKQNLSDYLIKCTISNQPPKILVTYDSLNYVLETIGDKYLSLYSIIVDEFQNIFMDSRFKADTELNFVSYLQSCPNVTYLSATPYIEEYLNELDEFKSLPYYEFKWHPDRLQTIRIDPRKTFRPNQEIDQIISEYLNGNYPEKIDENGKHQSKEAVFYVNSVRMICNIIKRNNLVPDQVNIICADTSKNLSALSKIHPAFTIGTAPLKGQPHKMFTFCTRTTYAGADFYSTSALSIIVSDCSVDSLATDIRMDFPQIMGRQRLKENVFRDECIFIYKLADSEITFEEFEELKNKKLEYSYRDLENFEVLKNSGRGYYENILADIRTRIKAYNYTGDYTGIDIKAGKPTINKLVMLSEKRAFELRSNVYKNDVLVYNEFSSISSDLDITFALERSRVLNNLRDLYRSKGLFEDKMKEICSVLLDPIWNNYIYISDFFWMKLEHRNYFYILGPERIKNLGYKEIDVKKEIFNIQCRDSVRNKLISLISIGKRYNLKELKEILQNIYNLFGISKIAKAADIEEYFNIKEITLYDKITKKKSRGYEILGLKE